MPGVTHREIIGSLIIPPKPGECFWCAGSGLISVPGPARIGRQ